MAKKPRLYDSLTQEDIEIFEPIAEKLLYELYRRMNLWKTRFGSVSKRELRTKRTVEWLRRVESLRRAGYKDELRAIKPMKSPEEIRRGEIVAELLNEFIPEEIQGADYIDACSKICSIMSVRSHERRKARETELERKKLVAMKRKSIPLSKKREAWLESMSEPRERQSDFLTRRSLQATKETPITFVPEARSCEVMPEAKLERQLADQQILVEAEFEQRKHRDAYPPPRTWYGGRKRRSVSRETQARLPL